MRELLADSESAKILGIKINQLYETVDFFDKYDDDPWDLVEGEHFEFIQSTGDYQERRFTEEGVEAIAMDHEGDREGVVARVMEMFAHSKRKRKQMLVLRRITQELIEANGIVYASGELLFVDRRTSINVLQTNGLGINNAVERLVKSDSLDGQEGLEIEKHFVLDESGEKAWSQKGLASIDMDMKVNSAITKTRGAWVSAVGETLSSALNLSAVSVKVVRKKRLPSAGFTHVLRTPA